MHLLKLNRQLKLPNPPPVDVTGVTVSPKTNNLEVGATRKLNVAIEPSDAEYETINYSSSDGGVASVNADGLVTANAEGSTTITVEVNGVTDTAEVNVTKPTEITTDEVTEEIDVVEYETVRNETDELPKGEEEVVQKGKNGYTKVTYKVTYEDGTEVDREEINRETIDPVDEIINVGTFEEPEPNPEG